MIIDHNTIADWCRCESVEAGEITESWIEEYNAIRPHQALGGLPPCQYAVVNDS